jgi:tetratricopeptide (TPR) repeat protein
MASSEAPHDTRKQGQQTVPFAEPDNDAAVTGRGAFMLLIGIVLAVVLVYSPVFQAGFLNLDDYRYVTVLRPFDGATILSLFTHPCEGYQPLSLFTLGLTTAMFDFNPWVHHALNVILHMANTALVFLLLRCVVERERIALLAAACFAILPAQVEPVAWIAARKDLLYAFFYLLGLLLYARQAAAPSIGRYVGVLACFALSALSKGMAVAFPLSLLAVDFLSKRPWSKGRILLDKLPFIALSMFFGWIAIAAQRAAGYAPQGMNLSEFPARLAGAVKAVGLYLMHLVNPVSLAAFHPWSGPSALAWGGGLLLGAAWLAAAVLTLRRSRVIAFSAMFFAVNIFLVLQLIPVAEFMIADRYLYVASVGFCLCLATGLDSVLAGDRLRRAGLAATGCLFVAMAAATFTYCRDWRDSVTVWSRTIARYPDSPFARSMRAVALIERNAMQDAIRDLDRAAVSEPSYPRIYLNRGVAKERLNDTSGALADYATFSRLAPYDPQGYNNRGMLLLRGRHTVLAISNLTAAVMLGGRHPALHMFLGNRAEARLRAGDLPGAIEDSARAIEVFPRHYRAFLVRAEALYRLGERVAAMRDLDRARAIDPADPAANDLLKRLAPQ